MDTDNTIVSPKDPAAVDFENATGELVMDDVHFRFHDAPEDSPDLFRGVNLHIRPGETLALVGVTGNGKSTLLQLVPRIFDITGGRITIDGVSVHDMDLDDLRRLTAFAFEDTTLFSFSVRDNVLLGVDPALPDDIQEDIAWEALHALMQALLPTSPRGSTHRLANKGSRYRVVSDNALRWLGLSPRDRHCYCWMIRYRRWIPKPKNASSPNCARY